MHQILTPREMAEVDRVAIERGPFDGVALIGRAGARVAALVLQRYPQARRVDVLCGPGNNGADGYAAAGILRRAGVAVSVFSEGAPTAGSDAACVAAAYGGDASPLTRFAPRVDTVVIDALYGAGLSRPVSGDVAAAIARCNAAGCTVVAVDLPSGISGETGEILGTAFQAALTVTFVRKKPGQLLQPGRQHCGEVVIADIGIGDAAVASVSSKCHENLPALWRHLVPRPAVDTYKYARGHVVVFSGGETASGAGRLSAMAAARIGAGAVTVLSPRAAIAANAAHLTSIMLKQADTTDDALDFMARRRPGALVYGPGLEPDRETLAALTRLLSETSPTLRMVVDAGGLTALAAGPDVFFSAARSRTDPVLVLTPHEGEFRRLFRDISEDPSLSKLERARAAAARSNAVVVYKGPDTVIAAPGGRAAINGNGTPWLATAGSGDSLAGIIAGLLAQDMPVFEAACAAVWIHAEAARGFGPGLIAEDLPRAMLPVLRDLHAMPDGA